MMRRTNDGRSANGRIPWKTARLGPETTLRSFIAPLASKKRFQLSTGKKLVDLFRLASEHSYVKCEEVPLDGCPYNGKSRFAGQTTPEELQRLGVTPRLLGRRGFLASGGGVCWPAELFCGGGWIWA